MRALELKIPPPVVALLTGAAMWFAPRLWALEVPLVLRAAGAVAIALGGIALALAGDVAFRRAKTTINPLRPQNATALVTGGVYRFSRNPMYLGLLLALAGWAVFLMSPPALLGLPAFVLYINRFQVAPEERILAAKFGDAYSGYALRVRRWL